MPACGGTGRVTERSTEKGAGRERGRHKSQKTGEGYLAVGRCTGDLHSRALRPKNEIDLHREKAWKFVWCVPGTQCMAFSLFNTAPGPGHTRVWACWIDQQAAKLTPSK
jgi:hypothetical protein